jgi:hypothetical protein
MQPAQVYPDTAKNPLVSIVKGVDKDVERGEDIIMLGYCSVLGAPMFAPIAPPHILLPLMALAFLISVCVARKHFHNIQAKLEATTSLYANLDKSQLKPLESIFAEYPKTSLTDGFNPLKNWLRTVKSILGALMINPYWMPIFYVLGLQFIEDKQFQVLNQAVIQMEQKTARWE